MLCFLEKALRERRSLRGIARIVGLSVQTLLLLLRRLAQALPPLRHSVAPGRPDDVLEPQVNSIASRPSQEAEKVAALVALCRRTRQVVAFVSGGYKLVLPLFS